MKKILVLGLAAGLISLSACNSSPREQAADNIESNTEAMADNMEDMADNTNSSAAADTLENQADAVRATGENQAEDMRTNDADTNLSNGM
jgi:protein involved in sex pheromone biosynthesis